MIVSVKSSISSRWSSISCIYPSGGKSRPIVKTRRPNVKVVHFLFCVQCSWIGAASTSSVFEVPIPVDTPSPDVM